MLIYASSPAFENTVNFVLAKIPISWQRDQFAKFYFRKTHKIIQLVN